MVVALAAVLLALSAILLVVVSGLYRARLASEMERASRNTPKTFTAAALRAMQSHRWTGNVRELANAVERAIIMSAGASVIEPEHLGLGPGAGSAAASGRGVAGRSRAGEVVIRFDKPPSLDDLRAAHLRLLLEMTRGNRREIAAILGISERNLYRILPQLEADRDRPAGDRET
jgi:DNA-binding NtrC family response regulator